MKALRLVSLVVLTLGASVFLPSCEFQKDHTRYIQLLDSLTARVDSAAKNFAAMDADTLKAMQGTIEGHLDYIQKNFVGAMRQDIAAATSQYKTTRKMLEQTATQIELGREEAVVTLQQLAQLKQALVEKATHDAAGNKMNNEYVQKAIGRETEEAGKLIKGRPQLEANAKKAKEKFLLQSPQIHYWVDSIPALATQTFFK